MSKELYFKATNIQPSKLATIIIGVLEIYLDKKFTTFNKNFSNEVDEHGVNFEVEYSSYYQQDPKWYSYADVTIENVPGKQITKIKREIKKRIKEVCW